VATLAVAMLCSQEYVCINTIQFMYNGGVFVVVESAEPW